MLAIYFNEYNELSDAKRNKMKRKYDPRNFSFEAYNYDLWLENEEPTDTTIKTDIDGFVIYLTCYP